MKRKRVVCRKRACVASAMRAVKLDEELQDELERREELEQRYRDVWKELEGARGVLAVSPDLKTQLLHIRSYMAFATDALNAIVGAANWEIAEANKRAIAYRKQ